MRGLFYFGVEERNDMLMYEGQGAGTEREAVNTERGKNLALD